MQRPFPDLLLSGVSSINSPVSFYNIAAVNDIIMKEAQNYDRTLLIYNKYINSITTKITRKELMNFKTFNANFANVCLYEAEDPDLKTIAHHYYELYFSAFIYHALL